MIIALVSLTVVIYSTGYLKPYFKQKRATGAHYFFLAILIIFMMLVVVVQQSIAFLVAWEIMSLSSFFLVAFENEKKEVFQAALFYLIAMHVGVIFLIVGFLLIGLNGGGFDFNGFAAYFSLHPHQGSLVFFALFYWFWHQGWVYSFPCLAPQSPSGSAGSYLGDYVGGNDQNGDLRYITNGFPDGQTCPGSGLLCAGYLVGGRDYSDLLRHCPTGQ